MPAECSSEQTVDTSSSAARGPNGAGPGRCSGITRSGRRGGAGPGVLVRHVADTAPGPVLLQLVRAPRQLRETSQDWKLEIRQDWRLEMSQD